MRPTVTIDTSEFQRALRRHLATTSRELSEAVNMRLAAVLMRTFLFLDPRNPQAKRDEVKGILTRELEERTRTTKIGKVKRLGRLRQFQFRHKIINAMRGKRGQAGLYGQAMRDASGSFLRGRTSSVGAMKALVVRMLRKVMPAFTQFGSVTKKSGGRQVKGNAMLIRLAGQYNHAASNVGVSSNISKRQTASGKAASAGWRPFAEVSGEYGVKTGQDSTVNARYQAAVQRAFADETREMLDHLRAKVLDNAEAAGFIVK